MPPKTKAKTLKEKGPQKKYRPAKKKLLKKEEEAAVAKKEAAPAEPKITEEIKPAVEVPAEEKNGGRYWEAVGRRKTAVARVRLFTRGDKGIWVNGKPHGVYFQYGPTAALVEEPLKKMKSTERFRVTAKITGGGMHAQAEALRHGISRALVEFNPDFRKRLKRAGYLTRDPRMKERKKFGLRGARRAPQWQKR